MSKEEQVVDILQADSELMAILTGGVYSDEEIGIEGIRRGEGSPTNAAFDAKGVLKPTAVVREGAEIAYANVHSMKDQIVGITQAIEVYFYQNIDNDAIFAAKKRTYELLQNTRLASTYPLIWMGDTPIFYDVGPVTSAVTLRQDWRCVFLKRPEA